MYLEKNKKRALTRFKLQKKKELISKRLSVSYFIEDEAIDIQKRIIGKTAITTKYKSCFGLGNPRRYAKGKDKLTIQERMFEVKKYYLED